MPQPGDIVLAAFPFADLSATKRRPCAVLANAESRGDASVAFVTPRTAGRCPLFGVRVDPSHPDWGQTHLKLPSAIALSKSR